jgi:hypothetical protein
VLPGNSQNFAAVDTEIIQPSFRTANSLENIAWIDIGISSGCFQSSVKRLSHAERKWGGWVRARFVDSCQMWGEELMSEAARPQFHGKVRRVKQL